MQRSAPKRKYQNGPRRVDMHRNTVETYDTEHSERNEDMPHRYSAKLSPGIHECPVGRNE
jgi:hypothetical protein